jgi:hypothetical protein
MIIINRNPLLLFGVIAGDRLVFLDWINHYILLRQSPIRQIKTLVKSALHAVLHSSSNYMLLIRSILSFLFLIPRFGSLFKEYPVLIQISSWNLIKFNNVNLAVNIKETFNVKDIVLRKSWA